MPKKKIIHYWQGEKRQGCYALMACGVNVSAGSAANGTQIAKDVTCKRCKSHAQKDMRKSNVAALFRKPRVDEYGEPPSCYIKCYWEDPNECRDCRWRGACAHHKAIS